MNKLFLLVAFYIVIVSPLFAQNSREEVVKRYVSQGKQLLAEGRNDSALNVLKDAFIKNAVLPDELLYYYALALFRTGDLDRSKKSIEKFNTITRSNHELDAQSKKLYDDILKQIDVNSVTCSVCQGKGYTESDCEYCSGKGEEQCDVCKGKGQVLVGTPQGMRLGRCVKCMGKGVVPCHHCEGSLKIKHTCVMCEGTGKLRKQ